MTPVELAVTVSGSGRHGTVQYALVVHGVEVAQTWDWPDTERHLVLQDLMRRWLDR